MKKRFITLLLCVTMTASSIFPVMGDEIPVETVAIEENIPSEDSASNVEEVPLQDSASLEEGISSEDSIALEEDAIIEEAGETKKTEEAANSKEATDTTTSKEAEDKAVNIASDLNDLNGSSSRNGTQKAAISSRHSKSKGAKDNDGVAEDGTVLPATYNPLIDNTYMVPLFDQGDYGLCWDVASMSVAEIGMVKKGLANRTDVDYSEKALAYFINSEDGVPEDKLGGFEGDNPYRSDKLWWTGNNPGYAGNYLMGWVGLTDESKAPYSEMPVLDENGKLVEDKPLDNALAFDDVAHVTDTIVLSKDDRDGVKELLMKNGAAVVQYYAYSSGDTDIPGMEEYCQKGKEFYVHKKDKDGNFIWGAYYDPVEGMAEYLNHSVTLIGWDDNFSRENFNPNNPQPENDGAWLIRNSWTTDDAKQKMTYLGYFWMSYEDKGLFDDITFLNVESVEDSADNIYQYDGVPVYAYWYSKNIVSCANVFEVKANSDGELLRSVAYESHSEDVDYSIDIYMNPDLSNNDPRQGLLVGHQEGVQQYQGYFTVDLDEPVPLSEGDTYSIVITLESRSEEDDDYLIFNQEGVFDDFWMSADLGIKPKQSFSWDDKYGWVDNYNIEEYETEGFMCKVGNNKIKGFTDNASTYSINYHSNDGEDIVLSQAAICGKEFALKDSLFEQEGKVQTGWNTAADGSGKAYSLEEVVNLSNTAGASIDLYAQWKLVVYKINYNLDGGTNGTNPSEYTVETDTIILKDPSKKGYDFVGWYNGDAKVTKIEKGTSGDITLTAKWEAEKAKWKKTNGKWWYWHPDGSYTKNNWEQIDGKWYHFDASGYMQTGWLKVGSKWYFLESNGAMAAAKWVGNYYLKADGSMAVNEWVDDNKYYVGKDGKWVKDTSKIKKPTATPVPGQAGWKKNTTGWWYQNSDGTYPKNSWAKIANKWYHFNAAGYMQTGWIKISDKWYYLENSGAMATGWIKISGKWYYLESNGAMAASKWIGNYYLKDNGVMATDEWIGKYHVDANGKWDKTK